MLGLDVSVDLIQVKDNMTDTRRGTSFVHHPENGLLRVYLDLLKQACTTRAGLFKNGKWDWEAVFLYQRKAEELDEMDLRGLYSACGQVPRGPGLLELEYENGSSTERGMYIWNGFMLYVTRYHKAKRSTNHEFIVPRFLPARLAHVMYKKMVYIRRFLDMLQRERYSNNASNIANLQRSLLFRSSHAPDKPWPTSRLSAILRRATAEVWGQSISSRPFRQLSISITEKYVREIHQPFNQYDDRGPAADLNVAFAWQSGHRPVQRGLTYGLDGAFPTKLQPALLRAYQWASTRLHEFLHQPSRLTAPSNPVKTPDKAPFISNTERPASQRQGSEIPRQWSYQPRRRTSLSEGVAGPSPML
jgi:hypothetical protein